MSRSVKLSELPADVRQRLHTGNRPVATGKAVKALRAAQEAFRRDLFYAMLDRAKLPRPATEVRFDASRKWRFDYAWPFALVALEVEGGIYSGGAHTRGKHFESDMAKYNAATVQGWRVLRTTPEHLASLATEQLLRKALGLSSGRATA